MFPLDDITITITLHKMENAQRRYVIVITNNHFLFLSVVRVNKSGNNLIDYGERFSKISENWVISVIGATL